MKSDDLNPIVAKKIKLPEYPLVYELTYGDRAIHHLTLFDLTSHSRARQAIEFGLKMRHEGFHIFVVGEDRSGRMTATLSYLNQYIKNLPPAPDWVYLNNFKRPERPVPFKLPKGKGIDLKVKIHETILQIHSSLNKNFSNKSYIDQIQQLSKQTEKEFDDKFNQLREFAYKKGFSLEDNEKGLTINPLPNQQVKSTAEIEKVLTTIRERIAEINLATQLANDELEGKIIQIQRAIAKKTIHPILKRLSDEFGTYLIGWIEQLGEDIIDNLDNFIIKSDNSDSHVLNKLLEYYAVNLLIDNQDFSHPAVYLESTPTYENLFGQIKYRSGELGGLETNFTMIRPGSLHKANGGILVLRAEALAQNPEVWQFLKAALRDQVIRIEERYRENMAPLVDAPDPFPIPLNIQVIIIGHPWWYYTFFYNDSDFRTYFKIKADIDPSLPATKKNQEVYANLLYQTAIKHTGLKLTPEAIELIMGNSARWIGNREKLTARFEILADTIFEAGMIARNAHAKTIRKEHVEKVLDLRKERNSRLEDLHHEQINTRLINIRIDGREVGQVNGLSVISVGDHDYGTPSRISARTYASDKGIVSIERLTEMGGPIQQKGTFILEGLLNGIFAQEFPISCGCSLTFEQNYDGVEGDSASLAEFITVLSSLSEIPLRQDMAITGSIDQFGYVQAVGGLNHKIEGFYRVCKKRGLTGKQGVIVPKANLSNIILKGTIAEDIEAGNFNIWAVERADQALHLLTEAEIGYNFKESLKYPIKFSKNTVFYLIDKKLKRFKRKLS